MVFLFFFSGGFALFSCEKTLEEYGGGWGKPQIKKINREQKIANAQEAALSFQEKKRRDIIEVSYITF